MSAHLNREAVERQISEMWDAIGSIPSLDSEGLAQAGIDASRIERNLRDRLEKQERVEAAAPELLEALRGLFEHCAMVHKHWGDNNNQREAEAAIAAASAAISKAEGGTT